MPKTGADRATLQCLLGTTRPQAGVLPWVITKPRIYGGD
jgi:hypothetical protein